LKMSRKGVRNSESMSNENQERGANITRNIMPTTQSC
jgi:hypothetical protein